MSGKITTSDLLIPIQFIHGFVRAAALCGIPVDDVLASHNIALDQQPSLPLSTTASISKFLINPAPDKTIFLIIQVVNDEMIIGLFTIISLIEPNLRNQNLNETK